MRAADSTLPAAAVGKSLSAGAWAPAHLHHRLRQAYGGRLPRDCDGSRLKALVNLDAGTRVLLQSFDRFACVCILASVSMLAKQSRHVGVGKHKLRI